MRRFSYLIVLVSLWSSVLSADPFVAGFDGPAEVYRIVRGEEKIEVSVFQDLMVGDQVIARDERFSLTLMFVDGTEVLVGHSNSPFIVESRGQVPGTMDNFVDWAKTTFAELQDGQRFMPVNLITRNVDVEPVMLLPFKGNVIAAGQRDLTFRFKATGVDLSMHLKGPAGQMLNMALFTDYVGGARVSNAILTEGLWDIELASAGKVIMNQPLKVVPADTLPPLSKQRYEMLPEHLKGVMYPMWLANQDEGRWLTEAYQLLLEEQGAVALQTRWTIEQKMLRATRKARR